jgi:glycosyltransferase involved in cell wall biosynthesis
LKVLVVSAFCPHANADSAGVLDVYHMLEHLSRRHEVTVVCPVTEEDESSLGTLRGIVQLVAVSSERLRPRWRYALRSALSLPLPLPAIAAQVDSPSLRAAVRRVAKADGFDVAHFAFTQTMHLKALLPDGIPTVIDESDVAFERRRRFASTIANPLIRIPLLWDCHKLERYELSWLARFDGVLLRTHREKDLLRTKGVLKRVQVISPWVDVSFRDSVQPVPAGRTVLFFGALWRPVNEDAALWMAREVFPRVRRRVPDARLALVGSRPTASVRGLAVSDIIVPGWVDSIAPWYQESAVVVAPLRAGSGVKGKVLQALGVGRPVVATPIGAEGIDATERDGLFVRRDAESIADAVVSLLQDDRGSKWHDAARSYFDRSYDFAAGCKSWESMLEQLATGCT